MPNRKVNCFLNVCRAILATSLLSAILWLTSSCSVFYMLHCLDAELFYVKHPCEFQYVPPEIGHSIDLGLSVNWCEVNFRARGEDYYDSWISCSVWMMNEHWWRLVESSENLVPGLDKVHLFWKGKWRMPTLAEWNELREKCDWVWSEEDDKPGYYVTSRVPGYEGTTIFLPAQGYLRYGGIGNVKMNGTGYYWTSTHAGRRPYAMILTDYEIKAGHPDWELLLSLRPVEENERTHE